MRSSCTRSGTSWCRRRSKENDRSQRTPGNWRSLGALNDERRTKGKRMRYQIIQTNTGLWAVIDESGQLGRKRYIFRWDAQDEADWRNQDLAMAETKNGGKHEG